MKALNVRLGASNWAWLPLTQTARKGRWSEGSACRPFETKPGYRHPAAAETHLHWTPSWLQLELEWWGREGHLQFRSGADGRTSLEEVGEVGHEWSQLPHFSHTSQAQTSPSGPMPLIKPLRH